jgi:hypothetical protein
MPVRGQQPANGRAVDPIKGTTGFRTERDGPPHTPEQQIFRADSAQRALRRPVFPRARRPVSSALSRCCLIHNPPAPETDTAVTLIRTPTTARAT